MHGRRSDGPYRFHLSLRQDIAVSHARGIERKKRTTVYNCRAILDSILFVSLLGILKVLDINQGLGDEARVGRTVYL